MVHRFGYLTLLSIRYALQRPPIYHDSFINNVTSSLVSAQRLFHRNDMYWSHPALQPEITVTVTATHLASPTGDSNACGVVYVPTTVTVYTSCISYVSSVSGHPISTYNTRGPWANSTSGPSTPCTQSWPTGITSSRNFSTSLGWNYTAPISYPTLTGTAGTVIESAEPVGTSSTLWGNSTLVTATRHNSTAHFTRTVTSSAIVTFTTVGAPESSGSLGTGTNHPGAHTTPTSYQSTMTYWTTLLSK